MKKLNSAILMAAAGLVASSATAAPVMYDGNSYEVIRAAGITWEDAKAAAEGMGGYLATVTSKGENDFIDSLRVAASLGQVWLGGSQPSDEMVAGDNWSWVTGEEWCCYTNWNDAEPNDNYGPGSEQHLGIGLFGDSTWNDEGALGNIYGYVVEIGDLRHCVPDGGSLGLVSLLGMAGMIAARRKAGRA